MARPRGLIVRRLNPDTLLNEVRLTLPEHRRSHIQLADELYLIETDRLFAVVGTEGVGHWSEDGDTCKVLCLIDGIQIQGIPVRTAHIRLAETSHALDLADVIRTFGDRLDGNHWLWFTKSGVREVA